MRRRDSAPPGLPGYVLRMDPERYRWAAVERLQTHPGDTHGAAMAVRRAFAEERRAWLRENGVQRRVGGRDTLTTALPPYTWVMAAFGTDAPRWAS